MGVLHVFSSIPVVDRDASMEWYERFIGRAADLIPNDSEAAWQLTDSGWLYILVEPDRAGTALNTLLVDELDAFLAGLRDREIVVGPIETMSNGVRFAMVADPLGNRLKIAQTIASTARTPPGDSVDRDISTSAATANTSPYLTFEARRKQTSKRRPNLLLVNATRRNSRRRM